MRRKPIDMSSATVPSVFSPVISNSGSRSRFARIQVRIGEPIEVARDLGEDQVESLRRHIEKRLADGLARIDAELHGQ